MDALTKKIQKLQEQKEVLEAEMKKLQDARNEEFIDMIRLLPAFQIDPVVLLGGLHYVIEEARLNPATAEVWRKAGQKFLKRKNTLSKNHIGAKEVEPMSAKDKPHKAVH